MEERGGKVISWFCLEGLGRGRGGGAACETGRFFLHHRELACLDSARPSHHLIFKGKETEKFSLKQKHFHFWVIGHLLIQRSGAETGTMYSMRLKKSWNFKLPRNPPTPSPPTTLILQGLVIHHVHLDGGKGVEFSTIVYLK